MSENGVPTHLHKIDRISEADLIPNGKVYSALPVSGKEGERTVAFDGTTYTFYQYLDGGWQQIGPSIGSHGSQYASSEYDNGNIGGAATIDWSNGNVQYATMTSNVTLTFTNPLAGGRYILHLAGAFTPTFPSTVRWTGGTTPGTTATAGHKDIYTLIYSRKEGLYDILQSPNYAIT